MSNRMTGKKLFELFDEAASKSSEELTKENRVLAKVYLMVTEFHRLGKGSVQDILDAALELREFADKENWTEEQRKLAATKMKEGIIGR